MCVDPSGFSRSAGQPYLHYVVMPSPIGVADLAAGPAHAASDNFGSLYLSPRTTTAQAIRAILLASATAATLFWSTFHQSAEPGTLLLPQLRRLTAVSTSLQLWLSFPRSTERSWRAGCDRLEAERRGPAWIMHDGSERISGKVPGLGCHGGVPCRQ
jgi:hypothetical protein